MKDHETFPILGSWTGDFVVSDDAPTHPFGVGDADRYSDPQELGRGGMGVVHCVRDQRLRRDVALKESSHTERLCREAWITAQLEHPGIVPVYDAGIGDDGQKFYTMRLIRGRTLTEVLADTDDRLRLLRSFLAACEAVGYAHALGVIHRDLKPSNIMVGEFGETQVVDWGLARPISGPEEVGSGILPASSADDMTIVGSVIGTPSYMSPEQAAGHPADFRSDVWGLGAVLYEIISGHQPFRGSGTAVVAQLRDNPVPAPPAGPQELVAICLRALSREPDARYANAKVLADDVEAFLDGRRVDAYRYTAIDLVARFVWEWRWQVSAILGALLVIAIFWVGATLRITQQRDIALVALDERDAALSRALMTQALTAHASHRIPEAQVLAAESMALGASAEARGVLIADRGPPPMAAFRHPLPEACLRPILSPAGTHLACQSADGVAMHSEGRRQWVFPREDAEYRFFGDMLAVFSGDDLLLLDVDDGSVREASVSDQEEVPRKGSFQRHTEGDRVFVLEGEQAYLWTGGGWQSEKVCNPGYPVVGWTGGENTVILCSDAQMMTGRFGTLESIERPSDEATEIAVTASGLYIGTSAGTLHRRVGDAWQSAALHVGRVRQLREVAPHLAVVGERGTVLVDPLSLTVLERLPSRVRQVGGNGVTLTDRGLESWSWQPTPERFVSAFGLTRATLSPAGLLSSDGQGFVTLRSLDSGRIIWEHRLNERVAKWIDVVPDGRVVASGIGRRGMVFLDASGREVGMLGGTAYRRVFAMDDDQFYGISYVDVGLEHFDGEDYRAVEGEFFDGARVGETFVAVSVQGQIWSGEVLFTDADAFAVSPCGDGVLVSRWTGGLYLADRDGTIRWEHQGGAPVLDVICDGTWAAAGHLDGRITVWDMDGVVVAEAHGHEQRVPSVDIVGETLISASWDGSVRLWDLSGLNSDPEVVRDRLSAAYGMGLDEVL